MTSSTPGPTWYDVLGVAPHASTEEVKAAWRTATDRFEPGTGGSQFRMFNEAADVLLDPRRRAEYDAQLAGAVGTSTAPAAGPLAAVSLERPSADAGTAREPARPAGRMLRLAAFLALPVLAALAIALAVVLVVRSGDASARDDARVAAQAAAERSVPVVLSYDYRRLPADRDRAGRYLTSGYKKEYLQVFSKLIAPTEPGQLSLAVKTKTVVDASVLGTGVVSAEPDRVRLVVYVNQVATKGAADPKILQNRAGVTMDKVDGTWLISQLDSY